VVGPAHRVEIRRVLAEHGIAQPPFAAVRTLHEGQRALEHVGLPAVLRADNVADQPTVFLLESVADLERHLHAALAQSQTQEAIVEGRSGDGTVLVAVVDRDGVPRIAEAMPPPGIGWFRPTKLFGDRLEAVEETAVRTVRALDLSGVVCIDLLATERDVVVLEVAPEGPRSELAGLVSQPDPTAVRLLTADPGPLPVGRVRRVGGLQKVLAFPGVVTAALGVRPGDTIEPMRLDVPRGYVIAKGDTNLIAIERADAAARLVDVEVW
jgi:formate-dependent phosphoribosylglycinamide formyltransferase (GAR transformylase)